MPAPSPRRSRRAGGHHQPGAQRRLRPRARRPGRAEPAGGAAARAQRAGPDHPDPECERPSPQAGPGSRTRPGAQAPGPAVGVAFAPGSALLPAAQQSVIQGVAAQRQDGFIRAVGFGDGSMGLALARARRIADALTAAGVPADKIKLDAFAAGSGGFVQLVY
ncbi:hypothetical protein GT370_17210 [Acidocella sp. MX-AZ03]|uniref:hypothetical protein n=1 Tax=Acidocella sp. MX-AZ03 TaxID=2697363 RepID=UPI0022DDA4DE|nr:hypothetical protein [Acidocella sp. MX-AZ03]WBO58826.1 hypothetical protein GT370_17210 [Acidocella sp. MX-AZ03]